MRNIMTLNNWAFIILADSNDIWTAPELLPKTFKGDVDNHPRLANGKGIAVSIPRAYDPASKVFQTASGSFYRLGDTVLPEDLSQFPNAVELAEAALASLPPLSPE